jgi:hypothetical protein
VHLTDLQRENRLDADNGPDPEHVHLDGAHGQSEDEPSTCRCGAPWVWVRQSEQAKAEGAVESWGCELEAYRPC